MDKKQLKEQFIKLFLEGKNFSEISHITGWSRTFITNLIKDDERVEDNKNYRKIKVYKRSDNKQMLIPVPTSFIKKLGISEDLNEVEYVDIYIDENTKNITIKKHSN